MIETWVLPMLMFVAALLYSSVGHAGASGYLAAMALCGIAPSVMKPSALALNIVVAVVGSIRFYRAGSFSWKVFWPFALLSIPLAYIGGRMALPDPVYKKIVGTVLLMAAWRLTHKEASFAPEEVRPMPTTPAMAWGSGIGLLSGMTGVGGGIFLSPLLWFTRWAAPRVIAGVSVVFILVNSMSGMMGLITQPVAWPSAMPIWAGAVLAGGALGSHVGSQKLGATAFRYLLAGVLIMAGVKMLLV